MANNCELAMKVVGSKENILKLFDEIPFYTDWTVETSDTWDSDAAESSATFYGDCAWSITSSMLDGSNEEFNLLDRTRNLGLKLEAYGQEPGIGFEEHYYIDRGELLVSETVDFQEHDLTVFDSRTEAEEALGFSISKEKVMLKQVSLRDVPNGTDISDSNRWSDYIEYLHEWAVEHGSMEFAGCSPACYQEWLDCENEEEEDG